MQKMLITGATSGIGEALALLAANSGYKVIACGRNQEKLATLAKHSHISTLCFDLSDESATVQALANVKCDIVVLNAGTCEYVDVEHIEPQMFKRVFDSNVFGTVNVVSALLPSLTRGNKLVFVDSLARLLPFTRSQAYGASKAAVNYIAKSLEVDLHDKGIKVQTLSPGFVKTPLTDKNDFDMPMLISAEQAATYMLKGIQSGASSCYFPRRFSAIIRFMHLLPEFLQRKACLAMRNKASPSRTES